MTACYVYEVFDGDGALIYIGSSVNVPQRMEGHVTGSWWSPQSKKVKAQVYPDTPTARTEEYRRIREKHPRWNIHRQATREHWTASHYEDYLTACHNKMEFDGRDVSKRGQTFRRIAREYKARFGADLIIPAPLLQRRAS